MKKTLLIIAVLLIASSSAFSQFKFGVGAAMGTKTGMDTEATSIDGLFKMNFGLNVRGVYALSETFSLGFGATYFLPTKSTEGSDEAKMTFIYSNIDGMYYFSKDESLKFYGLAGVNYAKFKTEFNGTEVPLFSGDGFSWEAGVGVEMGKFFIEGKYDGNMEQIMGAVGIYF